MTYQPTTRPHAYVYSADADMHLVVWTQTGAQCENCGDPSRFITRDLGGNAGDFTYCRKCWESLEVVEDVYYLP